MDRIELVSGLFVRKDGLGEGWIDGRGREEKGWMVYHSSSCSVNKEGEESIYPN